jgi:GntR family transcriptional regulator/MocR family aminotransferase
VISSTLLAFIAGSFPMKARSGDTASRTRTASSLLIALDPSGGETLQNQIYSAVRRAILDGALPPGARLPSSRALAEDLAVSRTTTLLAFEQLMAEGYLQASHGSGTFVSRELPDDRVARLPRAPASGLQRPLSKRGALLMTVPPAARRLAPGARAFRLGVPALDLFPIRTWASLAQRRVRGLSLSQLDYSDILGYRPLREAIAAHVRLARGAVCTPDQVVIVSGAQRGLDQLFRLLLDPGDVALLEEPGYPAARGALLDAGARIRPALVDAAGLNIEAAAGHGKHGKHGHGQHGSHGKGAQRGAGAKVVYVTPSHQFPLGVLMSLPRRLALLDWATRAGAWVVEDDYDTEFRYGTRPIPCLQGLDGGERVLYVGTFAKSLFPSLRLGFAIVPLALVEPLRAARRAADGQPHHLDQLVLADFIAEGHYERHLRRMRGVYAERLQAVLDSASRYCGDALRLRPIAAGLHLVGEVSEPDEEVAAAAAARRVEVMPLSAYYLSPAARVNGLVLGFGCVRPQGLREGMEQLAAAIDDVQRQKRLPVGRPRGRGSRGHPARTATSSVRRQRPTGEEPPGS